MDKKFERAFDVVLGEKRRSIATVRQARDALASVDWPNRGMAHERALEACVKVLEGYRSLSDAASTFEDAVREAGVRA